MCNAWNHPPGCDCGFGGDTGGGGWSAPISAPAPTHSVWQYRDDDFCRPTSCPICGADVFFVRHNGGSVWFDELGLPWPKHACFDDDVAGSSLRGRLVEGPRALFGVVVETVVTRHGEGGRIVVRCSDGSIIDDNFKTTLDLAKLVGQLVMVERGQEGRITLVPVYPPLPSALPPLLPPPA